MEDMNTNRHASGSQEFKLFGKRIPMKATQENDNPKGDDPPQKKPMKTLPCPRCKSMETKFCYFNNYNVNQPRHFCKGCQRYWTAGGTLRNVPFGAGRRKTRSTYRGPIGLSVDCLLDPSEVKEIGLSVDCLLDPSEVKELGLEGVIEQWHVSTSTTSKSHHSSSSAKIH